MRLKELAATRVRYGYRRLHILLRREGFCSITKARYAAKHSSPER
jgi:putative transposase